MQHPETDEIQMREEDGVRTRSVVQVHRGGGMCSVCLEDVPETAEIAQTEIYNDGHHRRDAVEICQGCAYRVGALFAHPGKELFCGILRPAD